MNGSRFLRIAAPLSALLLGGCLANASYLTGSDHTTYLVSAVQLAKSQGPLPVATIGEPFPPAEIVSALNALPNVHRVEFATDRPRGSMGYGVVLDFATDAINPCAPSTSGSPPADIPAGRLRVAAAFCRNGSVISRTVGHAPRPVRSDDPDFRRFLRNLLTELLPAIDIQSHHSDGCGSLPNC